MSASKPELHVCTQHINDQLNSIQILEQLAPLQLAKEHLLGDIVDILERLSEAFPFVGKAWTQVLTGY